MVTEIVMVMVGDRFYFNRLIIFLWYLLLLSQKYFFTFDDGQTEHGMSFSRRLHDWFLGGGVTAREKVKILSKLVDGGRRRVFLLCFSYVGVVDIESE